MDTLVFRLLVVLFCLVRAGSPLLANAQDDLEVMREAIAREFQRESGDIEVHGLTISESGELLSGVTIDVAVREFGDVTSGKAQHRELLIADGEFAIKKQEISSISLVFSKDGYYSTTWSYNFSRETPRQHPDGVERFEIEAILIRKPDPAPLRQIEGFVRATEYGSVDIVATALSKPAPVPLSGEKLRAWKVRKSAGPALQLEGQVDGQGRFVIEQYTPRGQNYTVDGLRRGWLRVSGGAAGDGFVRFTPEDIPKRPALGLRPMQTAPASGYADSLELGVALGESVVYFFCRIGGHYGKGMVSGKPYVVDGDEGQIAAAKVTVFLNPTGSRDVAYIHH